MHNTRWSSVSIVALALLTGCASHEGMSGHMNHEGMTSVAIPTGAVDVGNTVCPISGDKIEGAGFVEIYKGKAYHFCCSDCPMDFKKDPEKFLKLISDNPTKYGVKAAQ